MSLQLILGGSGAGKSHYLFQHIIEESMEHPQMNYLVIVPEQFTMQTQKELVTRHPNGGIMNIDVLSFERLAYRVFEEVGVATGSMLEEIGKSFVLQKIALERRKDLPFLGKNLAKPGYIYEMKSMISELKQYDIQLEDLDDMIERAKGRPQLEGKLKDVRTVYKAFGDYTEDKYMTAEDVLTVLGGLAEQSVFLKNSVLAFDGFTGFTPVQNRLLGELLRLDLGILVTVTVDLREQIFDPPREQELFSMSKKMVRALCHLAAKEKAEILPEIRIFQGKDGRFGQSPALSFLEQNLFRFGRETWGNGTQEIRIFAAKNPLREVRAAADRIRRLVREEGYRYRDIVMITGDLELYGNYVRQVFAATDIPYFIDEKRYVWNNPYVEYLRGAMAVEAEHYSYNSMFRYLRSGISDVNSNEVDRLENYVLALGIRGYKNWNEKWLRHYKGMKPEETEEIDGIRGKVMKELEPFHQTVRRKGKEKPTVRQLTKALYQMGFERKVQEKLKEKENRFVQMGRPDMVREYAQIYGKIMSFLDKLVDVLGDEIVSFSDYQTILEAGFMETKIGIIPPSTDQILVGDMERTRLKDVKVLLFLGVNEGLIPKGVSKGGILSESDREFLEAEAFELKPSPRTAMYIQKFYLYLNLTKPSHKLYLSFSGANSQGENIGPAYLIGSIRKLFPDVCVEEEPEQLTNHLESPETGMEYLIAGLRQNALAGLTPQWKELYSWYVKNGDYADRLYSLLEASYKRSPKDSIGRAMAKALYGNVLENSATRLERFAACAFSHFIQYGLQLRERQQYEFTGMDMGNIVHTALESFSKKVSANQYDWHSIEDEEREALIQESVEEVIHDYGNTILHSSARNEYMIARVRRILSRTVWALQEQVRRGDFVPNRFEVSFRMEENLKSINIDLSDEEKMKLTGRIDRLDTYEDGENIYVKVIDYKSGGTSFDLVAVYYGLQLQLVLYLNAALELMGRGEKEAKPAGMFYYNVKDPVEEWKEQESEDELRERILKDLKVNGLVQADKHIIEHLDASLGEGQTESSIIPVKYNKNGSLSASSSVAGREQFAALSGHVSKTIGAIGREILDGKAAINPYEQKGRTGCDYCTYAGICGFDGKIPGYGFRRLNQMKKDDVWRKMGEEEDAHGCEVDQGTTEGY